MKFSNEFQGPPCIRKSFRFRFFILVVKPCNVNLRKQKKNLSLQNYSRSLKKISNDSMVLYICVHNAQLFLYKRTSFTVMLGIAENLARIISLVTFFGTPPMNNLVSAERGSSSSCITFYLDILHVQCYDRLNNIFTCYHDSDSLKLCTEATRIAYLRTVTSNS